MLVPKVFALTRSQLIVGHFNCQRALPAALYHFGKLLASKIAWIHIVVFKRFYPLVLEIGVVIFVARTHLSI
jgi:hypothetical protein